MENRRSRDAGITIATLVRMEFTVKIRPTKFEDIPALKLILDGTELFPSEILTDMLNGFLNDLSSDEVWLTSEMEGVAVGFSYAVPEKLTNGAWNMLALAVLPSHQGQGLGTEIVKHLELDLRALGHRILIVETSSANQFEQTRAFYEKCGYVEEARIRDFWAAGDDKVVFWKALS
jgi:ribosomal protein S18 acetylase RimI-like enzyme